AGRLAGYQRYRAVTSDNCPARFSRPEPLSTVQPEGARAPSGHLAPVKSALRRSAWVRSALRRFALVRFALVRFALRRSALSRFALASLALVRSAPLRSALVKFAPLRAALVRTPWVKPSPGRNTLAS